MANVITAPVPILVDSVKVGEATGGEYEVSNGVERIPISDGTAFTLGRVVTGVTFKTVIPRAGHRGHRLFEAVTSRRDVKIQLNIDGKYHEMEGKLTNGKGSWEVESGRADGDWTFVGGEPLILG